MNPYDNLLSNTQKQEMEMVRQELERVARAAREPLSPAGRPANKPQPYEQQYLDD